MASISDRLRMVVLRRAPGALPLPALAALLLLALCAFAANSILCRLALGGGQIDAVSYTSVRLAGGAFMLGLVRLLRGVRTPLVPDPLAAAALFAYAICFSLAYVALGAAAGALLLFCAVQMTMIGGGVLRGERPPVLAWLGLAVAGGGLVYLLAPGLAAPPVLPAGLMLAAGFAWGLYSLRGAGRADPVEATTANFIAAAPLALVCSLVTAGSFHATAAGASWALLSGAVTSALGYVLWYRVLPQLSATLAASVQLAAPLLTALCGVWLLGERFSPRLALAGIFILGGIGLIIGSRRRSATRLR
jgi:drug/metabolite transporter (DMT)-like permease